MQKGKHDGRGPSVYYCYVACFSCLIIVSAAARADPSQRRPPFFAPRKGRGRPRARSLNHCDPHRGGTAARPSAPFCSALRLEGRGRLPLLFFLSYNAARRPLPHLELLQTRSCRVSVESLSSFSRHVYTGKMQSQFRTRRGNANGEPCAPPSLRPVRPHLLLAPLLLLLLLLLLSLLLCHSSIAFNPPSPPIQCGSRRKKCTNVNAWWRKKGPGSTGAG